MLMLGMPGSGKTMAAKAVSGILPPLAEEEALELAKIYSVCGMFGQREGGQFWTRPFRSPIPSALPGWPGAEPSPSLGKSALRIRASSFWMS
jgi:magnesium chelatase family protein